MRLPDGRSYLLHGQHAAVPVPLVIALHMATHDARFMEQQSGLSALADRDGFVVAYGEGVRGYWNAGGCCGGDTADDLAYLRAVVHSVEQRRQIDPTRVYLIGMSNGGMMAYRAVCELSEIFAAAGVVAGALMPGVRCRHSIVRVYEIHGISDATVPLDGGIGFQDVVFPPQRSDLTRTAPGSVIKLKTWNGGHAYPGWATPTLWAWLETIQLPSGITTATAHLA